MLTMLHVRNLTSSVYVLKEILSLHLHPMLRCRCTILLAKCQTFSTETTGSSETARDESNPPEQQQPEPPHRPDRDWIGPVDRRSNLRQIRFAQRQGETVGEKEYREMREEIYKWNHTFWARHNQNFIEAKERFVQEVLSRKGVGVLDEDGAKRVLSADEMAQFYREFLQDNQSTLKLYNREWYRRNTALLWPACKTAVQRLFRR